MRIDCTKCKASAAARLRWQACANGVRHIRVECSACGTYARYANQTPENVAEAETNPEYHAPGSRSASPTLPGFEE